MSVLAQGAEAFQAAVEDCDPPLDEILGFPVSGAAGLFESIVTEIAGALADSKFEVGLNGLSDELTALADGEGPVVRTYEFNKDFYQEFSNYVRTSVSSFIDQVYTAPNYFSSERAVAPGINFASALGTVQEPLQLKFGFPTFGKNTAANPAEEYLRVTYPNNVGGASQLIDIDYKSTSGLVLDDNLMINLEQSVANQALAQNNSNTDPINVYIQPFVDAFADADLHLTGLVRSNAGAYRTAASAADDDNVVHSEFPKAYASLVQNMIEYILENGAFDVTTLQSLQLFHVNTDCPEDEVADLLDIQGILEQVTREYAEQACNDRDVSLRDKFRRSLKFGLMLLYIQLSISEFIIKNIFVFSAFTLDSMLNDRNSFLFRFFRKQAKLSLVNFLENPPVDSRLPNFRPENMQAIKTDLVSYFGKKIARPSVVANGGNTIFPGPG